MWTWKHIVTGSQSPGKKSMPDNKANNCIRVVTPVACTQLTQWEVSPSSTCGTWQGNFPTAPFHSEAWKTQGRCDTYWQKGGNSVPRVMAWFGFKLSGTLHTHKCGLKVWTRTTSCTSLINSLLLPETSQGAEGLKTHPSREEILTDMMTILTVVSLSVFQFP